MPISASTSLPIYIIEKIEPLEYDPCVITGDFTTKHLKETEVALDQLKQILPHIKAPCLAVLGNHDQLEIVPKIESLGIQVLLNEVNVLEKGGQRLYIGGIDDPSCLQTNDIPKIAKEIPDDAFSILLAHSTCSFQQTEAHGLNLLLAEHSHGGQLCLPGGIPFINNARSPTCMIQGSWQYGGAKRVYL